MTESNAGDNMSLVFAFKSAGQSIARDDAAPFRIAILGDFSGHADHRASSYRSGNALRIDCDNFETVFAQIDPTLLLPPGIAGVDELRLRFRRLEDFRPDELVHQIESLSRLVELRPRLLDPVGGYEAGAELRELLRIRATGTEPSLTSSTETNEDLLTRLLGKSASERHKTAPISSAVDNLIKQIVAPSIVPSLSPQQAEFVSLADGELSRRLREILHQPDFQALEAAWRGLDFLIRQVSEDVKLNLIDIAKGELASLLSAGDLVKTAISKQLEEIRPAVVLGIYSFGPEDLALLKVLACLAEAHHTAFVAGASSAMVGCSSFGSQRDPDDWTQPRESDGFETLRRTPAAAHLGLLMPRFLLRQPYGRGSDPIEPFPFEEMPDEPQHESYLWGNPCFLCGYLLADAFGAEGWALDARGGGEVSGLPVHTFRTDGETQVKPCAEAWLSERAANEILAHGIVPVVSIRGRDAVEISTLQALSKPSKPLSIRYG